MIGVALNDWKCIYWPHRMIDHKYWQLMSSDSINIMISHIHSGTELNLDEHDYFRLLAMLNKSWISSTVNTGASVFCAFQI